MKRKSGRVVAEESYCWTIEIGFVHIFIMGSCKVAQFCECSCHPPAAVALICMGLWMMASVRTIDWDNLQDHRARLLRPTSPA